jgi:hypothetical protein
MNQDSFMLRPFLPITLFLEPPRVVYGKKFVFRHIIQTFHVSASVGKHNCLAIGQQPIAGLSFLSKLIERVVHHQFSTHLRAFHLLPDSQSAYRTNYSTETALLGVYNDSSRPNHLPTTL